MTEDEVHSMLEENQDARGIEHWKRIDGGESGLRSHGIGLTRLRKMAKTIGRDHQLSRRLWASDCYDAKVLALLIDEPASLTRELAEAQVEQLAGGHLAHVFSSCDATLAKAPFVLELAEDWMVSPDPMRRRCGYGLLYEISKSTKKSAPSDERFLRWVRHIAERFAEEPVEVLLAMGTALMGIGKRNAKLNRAALKVARRIGPIHFDESGTCEPMVVEKHLTSDYLKAKLGL